MAQPGSRRAGKAGSSRGRCHWAVRGLERDRCDCSSVLLSTSACPWPSHRPSPSVSPWEAEKGSDRPCWMTVWAFMQSPATPSTSIYPIMCLDVVGGPAPFHCLLKSFALRCHVQTCKFAFDSSVRFHREDRCPIPALIKKAP